MITGNTNEKVVVSGSYYCSVHSNNVVRLLKGSLFSKCNEGDHETEWILKHPDKEDVDKSDIIEPKGGAKNTDIAEKIDNTGKPEEKNKLVKDSDIKTEIDKSVASFMGFEKTYKREGFFAAIHQINYPSNPDDTLLRLLQSEKNLSDDEINAHYYQYTNRLDFIKQELDNLWLQRNEKERMKEEFIVVLQKMDVEYDGIRMEINEHYAQLRGEIKALGESKDNVISKRIEEFEKEINKVIAVFNNVEDIQNQKFKKDFIAKNIQEKDKKFYYDYRDMLEHSFNDIQRRATVLRVEGLSDVTAKFLIAIGWISTIVSSWFFELWHDRPVNGKSTSILVYILDNLRNFVLNYGWGISLTVFLGYIVGIMIISWLCFLVLRKSGFIKKKNDKKEDNTATDSDENIEFNLDKELKFKSKFKAATVYEMWLKITPYVAIILLMVIILALGSAKLGANGSYEALSHTLYLQFIGFLLPVSSTVLGFLYIIRIIETRLEDNDRKNKGWEIILAVLFFFILIILLIVYTLNSSVKEETIGAWGFLIGCLCTSLSLGYGYRYLSLMESSDVLFNEIYYINKYINVNFYPWDISYLKYSGIVQKMKKLYNSLLNMSGSRNDLAMRLLNLHYAPEQVENEKVKAKEELAKESINEDNNEPISNEESNGKGIWKWIANFFKQQEIKWKRRLLEKDNKIKDMEQTIADMKKDTVTIDEFIYFPVQAAKIKEIKIQIDERNKRLEELKSELEGYYKNEKTYASLNRQIETILEKRVQLSNNITVLQAELQDKIKKANDLFLRKKIFIQEGYQVGLWFRNNPGNDSII